MEPAHRKSDWYFGVWLPLICIYFDPFVFRTWSSSDGLLDEYRPFVYLLSSVSVMAMVAWLLWGERLEWLNGWFAGIFFAASAVSLVIGLILFPFSLLGLLALIGFLGFTPLVTAVVFARNGIRAIRAAEPFFERRTLFYAVTLGGLISLIVPYLLNNL